MPSEASFGLAGIVTDALGKDFQRTSGRVLVNGAMTMTHSRILLDHGTCESWHAGRVKPWRLCLLLGESLAFLVCVFC